MFIINYLKYISMFHRQTDSVPSLEEDPLSKEDDPSSKQTHASTLRYSNNWLLPRRYQARRYQILGQGSVTWWTSFMTRSALYLQLRSSIPLPQPFTSRIYIYFCISLTCSIGFFLFYCSFIGNFNKFRNYIFLINKVI